MDLGVEGIIKSNYHNIQNYYNREGFLAREGREVQREYSFYICSYHAQPEFLGVPQDILMLYDLSSY